jgi:predicted metal-dependent hydrolase
MNDPSPLETRIAIDLFKADVRAWGNRIGVEPKEIHVRDMTRKWGSASSKGRLTFDVDLLREPKEHRDEVIVHELVHLKVGGHGPLFRQLVAAHLGESSDRAVEPGPQQSDR